MSVEHLSAADLEVRYLRQEGPVLVDFYAEWCNPCKMLGPVLEEISQLLPDLPVGKVNVDEQKALAHKYRVMSIPTVLFFKDGKEQARMVGFHTRNEILDQLNEL